MADICIDIRQTMEIEEFLGIVMFIMLLAAVIHVWMSKWK